MSSVSAASGPWTIARLLQWTREYFTRAQLESPRLCAEILLAHVLQCDRLRLLTRHDEIPRPEALEAFRELVRQAAGGAPIAYLVGQKEFFSQPFQVTPAVLIPRPETEVLVERVIHLARSNPDIQSILEIGVGSGCILLSLARHLPDVRLYGSDISADALAVATDNARRQGLLERVELRVGDLFAPWADGSTPPFDLIVANPPYVAETAELPPHVVNFEPHVALFAGPDGLDAIRRVAREAAAHLRPDGHLLLEIGYDQFDAVTAILHESGWRSAIGYLDTLGRRRAVHVRRCVESEQARIA